MKTILLIEDEKNILLVFSKLLKKAGYRVLTADNGIKGLEIAQESKPDLIILDLLIPKLDGLVILETLKEEENTTDIPVVIISANSNQNSIENGLKAGAENYLVKPISRNELLLEIKKHI